MRHSVHPPLLKIFKRDGVLIFESKKNLTVLLALLTQDLNTVLCQSLPVLTFEFFSPLLPCRRRGEGSQGDRFLWPLGPTFSLNTNHRCGHIFFAVGFYAWIHTRVIQPGRAWMRLCPISHRR